MNDAMERTRRLRIAEINAQPGDREALEARVGTVWDTDELGREYEVLGFLAPIVAVIRKADGKKGSLEFQHLPRFYFNWVEDRPR